MFSLLNKIRFVAVFLFFIFMVKSSTSSPLDDDKLAKMTERLDRMQTKIDAMQSREAQLTERLDRMQNKMDSENDKWTKKFGDLEAENEKLKTQTIQQKEELQHLKRKISHPESSLSAPKWVNEQSSRLLTSPPTSCQELKDNNGLWPMDGIHLLKKQNKIMAAFCTFKADGSLANEAAIGQLNVETRAVHFYVQRTSSFGPGGAVIPFDVQRLNEGGAFNLSSGIFTAPVPGIYHFDFSALKSNSAIGLWVNLQVNGNNIGRAATHTTSGNWNAVSLSASLRLAAGDRVNLHSSTNGLLYEDGNRDTNFVGWLVEEDLM